MRLRRVCLYGRDHTFGVIVPRVFVGIEFFLFFKVSMSERYYVCSTSPHMDEQKV